MKLFNALKSGNAQFLFKFTQNELDRAMGRIAKMSPQQVKDHYDALASRRTGLATRLGLRRSDYRDITAMSQLYRSDSFISRGEAVHGRNRGSVWANAARLPYAMPHFAGMYRKPTAQALANRPLHTLNIDTWRQNLVPRVDVTKKPGSLYAQMVAAQQGMSEALIQGWMNQAPKLRGAGLDDDASSVATSSAVTAVESFEQPSEPGSSTGPGTIEGDKLRAKQRKVQFIEIAPGVMKADWALGLAPKPR